MPVLWPKLRPSTKLVPVSDTGRRSQRGSIQTLPALILAELVTACPLAIISVGLDGLVTSWNPAAERLFGWPKEEVLGTLLPVVPPANRDDALRIRTQTEHGQSFHDVEVVRQRRDGSSLALSLFTAPLHDEHGQIVGSMLTYVDLMERKAPEEALRQSEQRYRATFEHAAIGITRIALDGSYLEVNPGFCEIVGYRSEELFGRSFAELSHPEDRGAGDLAIHRLLAGEQTTYKAEKRYLHKNGHVIWVRVTVSLLRDPSGAPEQFVAIVEDINQRRAAEETLRRQSMVLGEHAALLDLTQEGIFVRELGTSSIRFWNRGAEALYGWTKDEAIGARSHDLLQTAFPEPPTEIEETVLRTGRWTGDLVHSTKDGRRIVVSSRWALHRDDQGVPIGALEVNADITDRKRVEEALQQSEEQLRTLIDQAPVGICVITRDGIFEQVNDAYAAILGYEPHELFGKHFSMVMPTGRLSAAAAERRRYLEDGSRSLIEAEVIRKDGRPVPILATTIPLTDVDGTQRRVTFGVDITERKEAERALEHQAQHDALTGLPNRALLRDRLDHALTRAKRQGAVVAILFVDLDGFKEVNDHLGHERGDEWLKRMARHLVQNVRAPDTVARLAGDEFVVVLPDIGTAHNAAKVAEKVLETLRQETGSVAGATVSASIGISLYPVHGQTGDQLLALADDAMYRAKNRGKNTYALSGDDAHPRSQI